MSIAETLRINADAARAAAAEQTAKAAAETSPVIKARNLGNASFLEAIARANDSEANR
jgi:hypothetical protein